jgi:tRNA A-37 threonylcarbamoyl transferase component Bud32
MRQLQQELVHYKGQCEELTRQNEFERQQRYASEMELEGLRQECAQNRNLVATLQQQLREVKQNEWQIYQELVRTKDELSKCEEDRSLLTRERDDLNHRLVELMRERDNFNPRLREMSSEIERLREDLDRTQRERREAIEERDRSIRDLERRLREVNSGTQEHGTNTTQILISLGDGWNVLREEIELFPDREIGRGASGLVLEGRYQSQQVAVKQIHQRILENSTVVEEFRREIGIMASVKHPNLVRFIAAVFDDAVLDLLETPLLVSELLNTSLRKAYERGDVEGQQVRHSIFRDVAYGLHYLHEHQEPIIHRDISSANILLEALSGSQWRAKLSDFGSANFLKRATTLGVGALVYTAPEMFPREGPSAPMPLPTTKCDVFSYGIVVVEVITKTSPTRENRHQTFEEARGKWPLMHELASRCTETVPEARLTMSEVLNTLNRIPIARPRVRSFPSLS